MFEFIWIATLAVAVFMAGWCINGILHRSIHRERKESLERTKWLLETATEELSNARAVIKKLQSELADARRMAEKVVIVSEQEVPSKEERIHKMLPPVDKPRKEKKVSAAIHMGGRPTPPPPPPRIPTVVVHEHHHSHSHGSSNGVLGFVAGMAVADAMAGSQNSDDQVDVLRNVDFSTSVPDTCVDTSYSAPSAPDTCVDASYSAPSYDSSPSFDSCSSDTSSSWSND